MAKKTSKPTGHTTDDATRSPEDFKLEVLQELKAKHENSAPGMVGAFNPAGALHKIDAFAQKVGPILSSLTPANYALLIQAAAALIHAADGAVNPAS